MILYEVNITLSTSIAEDFLQWLGPHIHAMLQFPGFLNARYFTELETTQKNIIVQYHVDSMDNLQHYLQNHATTMRSLAVAKYQDKVSFSRRILELVEEFV